MSSRQFEIENSPADVISAVAFAPQTPNRLLVSSWDKNVYLYDIQQDESAQLVRVFEQRAPVLDVCFGEDDNVAYSGGLDHDVRRIDLHTGEQTVLSSHAQPIKSVVYDSKRKVLISGSWDSTLHVHLLAEPDRYAAIIPLPSKPFSLSITPTKLVVAMANRNVHVFDLETIYTMSEQGTQGVIEDNVVQITPAQQRESSMKFMTRSVACMPNDQGYATSSIEGRIAVDWFDESEEVQKKKYAFKCHRQTENEVDVVYPVNSLVFHPVHIMTFASGGGDGTVSLWDGKAKRRIRQYQKFPSSVSALAFSRDGRFLAVAVSPGFEDGKEDPEGVVRVIIRELSEDEAAPKKK